MVVVVVIMMIITVVISIVIGNDDVCSRVYSVSRNNQLGLASPRSPPVAPANMGSFSNYTAGQVSYSRKLFVDEK